MSEQIIKIAQANDSILNNLLNTDNKLNQLNQKVGSILKDYQVIDTTKPSFFNFDNPFFLLTLIGLFVLAFSLWLLAHELKVNKHKKNKKVKKEKLEIKVAPKIEKKVIKEDKPNNISNKKISSKKIHKIKVIKIK